MGANLGAYMAKITIKELQALTSNDNAKTLFDEGGIRGKVRVNKNSISVDFSYRYSINKKSREIRLGTWPKTSLSQIRINRNNARNFLDLGLDPIDEKLKKLNKIKELKKKEEIDKTNLNLKISFDNLFEKWHQFELVNRKDGGKDVKRIFEKDVLPVIGHIAVADIRKTDITHILDNVLSRNARRMAKIVLTLLRQIFRFAEDRDIVESNPTSSIRKAKIGGKDVIRERFLSEDEIINLHIQLPNAFLLKTSEQALWIIMSTCCRVGELCMAKWDEINFDRREWFIPAENSKNGKSHTISLSDFSFTLFNDLKLLRKSDVWVFPNSKLSSHVCKKSITKQVGDRQLNPSQARLQGRSKHSNALILKGGKWTPHDLRRTGATTMGNLGIRPDVIELCLNHTEQNLMKKTYQHQTLKMEQKNAWMLLGTKLEELIALNLNNINC